MADNKVIFSMEGVTKTYPPSKQVLKNIWLSFFYGAKIGVLGLNGSGKSSLLRIIAGKDTNYQGKVWFDGNYKIGLLEQEPHLDESKTVRQIVEEAVQPIVDMLKEYEDISMKLAEPMDDDEMMKLVEKQGELLEKIEHVNGWELDHRLGTAMESLRCPPEDALIGVLSGGERRRVALTRLLLSQPDILLLDEPTNHLDAESVLWLEQFLKNFPGTVIAVTHDRYFRATIPPGSIRNRNAWSRKKRQNPNTRNHSSANWNGFAWVPRDARQKGRRVSTPTINSAMQRSKSAKPSSNSSSRRVRASVMSSSRRKICQRDLAIAY
jgi:ATPase subunit of ABC transporter with duplicated ATPase domains